MMICPLMTESLQMLLSNLVWSVYWQSQWHAALTHLVSRCCLFLFQDRPYGVQGTRDIIERPHAPSGVAAFMSAHSKNPYSTAYAGEYAANGSEQRILPRGITVININLI